MKISRHLFLCIVLSAPAAAAADDPAGAGQPVVDTSNWKCKYCEFEKGLSAEVELGAGNVSDDSFKFGEYTGLNEKGGFVVGNAGARYRGEDASYWDVNASDLGLDSRSLDAEGGKQGKYRLILQYDELPHFISDSAATPFLGAGEDSLVLPPGWVRAGTTGGMTALPGSLHEVDLETKRKRLGVGVSFLPFRHWEYSIKYRHETKEGTKRIAGAFFFNSAQLVEPVDYVTDQVDVAASYAGEKWQAKLAYYGSMFRNSNDSLVWDNPFTSLVAGADAGQLAAPPDNQFHQIVASAGFQFTDRTRATIDIAAGRMEQDEDFLDATLNAALVVPALPRRSLDGRVDTLTANVKVISALTDKLRLNAAYTYDDRDNRTPQATYDWVTTDTFLAVPRTNLPYSFTQSALKLSADYRAAPRVKSSIGFDHDSHERTFQEVDKTRENTIWGKVITRALDNVDLTVKYAHAKRDKSNYEPVPETDPPQNPLLRKYNMADRTRDTAGFHAAVTPRETVNVGFGIDFSRDDYSHSEVGLTDSQEINVSADTSVMLTKKTSFNVFLNHERIASRQAGSQTFSTPDWFAENDDTINTAGVGVKHAAIKNKLDVGADYTVSRSRGEITVDTGAPDPLFPDLITKLDSLKLYATYRLKGGLSLHAAYWYERYNTKDWTLDGVTSSIIPNVLTFGEETPSYDVNVITLSARYKF